MQFRNTFAAIFGFVTFAAPAVYGAGWTTPDNSGVLSLVSAPTSTSANGLVTFSLDLKASKTFTGGSIHVETWRYNHLIKQKDYDVCTVASTYGLGCTVSQGTSKTILVPIPTTGANTTVKVHATDASGVVLLDMSLWTD